MEYNAFTWLFLAALALMVVVRAWLATRQLRHVRRHRSEVPEAFRDTISPDEHARAADYTVARVRFGFVDLAVSVIILLGWTLAGGIEVTQYALGQLDLGPVFTGSLVVIGVFLVSSVLELPLSAWRQFVIEERFGFNRMTPGLFLADLLKGGLLMLVLGLPLAAAALWLMHSADQLWWLWVWALWMAFSLLMLWAYPAFIAPLFNKFSPLEDEDLKQRIEALLDRCGFTSRGVFVMDGSKRSAHGNAYFTGVGNNKRIVFFDTLLDTLDAAQIEAVLAHELGHFRMKHIPKRILVSAVVSLGALALLGWLEAHPWFYEGLGVTTPSKHAALLLFMLAGPVFTFLLSPLGAAWSRKHEFEADEYANRHADAGQLITALVDLYRENASTLTPDPVHSAFYDSHPPAPVRIRHLSRLASGG